MGIMNRIIRVAVLLLLFATSALAQSTINPNVPAQGAPIASAPIRQNFLNANTDINGIITGHPGGSPPAAVYPFEDWLNIAANPWIWKKFVNQTVGYTTIGTIDPATGQFVVSGSSSFAKLDSNNTFTGVNSFSGGIVSSAITSSGTVTINPAAGSFTQGVDITQTGPVGGTFAGPISFNTINVVDQGGTNVTGAGYDDYGLAKGNMVGFRVNYASAGGDIRGAMIAAYRATSSLPGSYYGSVGSIYTNVAGGGLLMWGNIGVAQVGTAGAATLIIGLEGEVAVYGAGTVAQRIAVSANTQGPNAASTDLDAAFAVTAGGGTAGFAPFKKMFAISSVLYGGAPLAATGDIFWADTSFTIANVFNSSNWNVTGNFADFPNFGINGASGVAAFGIPVTGVIGSQYGLVVGGASKGVVAAGVSTNTATGSSFLEVRNSTIGAQVDLLVNESVRTTVRYGVSLGNYSELTVFSGNGQIIGTQGVIPIIFGTNNIARMQIAGDGQVNIGPNVASSALFTVNANTTSPSNGGSNTIFQLSGANGVTGLALMDSYGGSFGAFAFRSAQGSGGAFTHSLNGDGLGLVGFVGATASNTFANTTGGVGGAFIAANATEDWDATHNGTRLKFFTTPNGTFAINLAAIIQSSGCVSVGTTTDCGAGGVIDLLTGLRIGNAAVSGNVLRGNGTNFVSAKLACADLAVACITGNQTITLSGGVSGSGTTTITATLDTAQASVHTWALAQTFTVAPVFTDQPGSRTALGLGGLATVTPGSGVATALAINVGSAGAFTTFNGALGTPLSISLANAIGLPLTTGVTGILPIANGGTGIATGTGTPNFKAYLNTAMTGLGNGSTQKVLFDTIVFDSGSYWDATNKRYKPLVAGTYRVSFTFVPSSAGWINQSDAILGVISKNGTFGGGGGQSTVFLGVFPTFAAIPGDTAAGVGSTTVAMNGSTDTLEIDVSVATSGGTYSVVGSANMVTQVAIERIGP